jgi:superfamily I DNA/RNA helicase
MTLHASKGLEFPCVFITGCEDGLLPYGLFETSRADPTEERRLLYVGMTRAQTLLYMTWAQSRFLNNRPYNLSKSPFLEAIEQELVESSQTQLKKSQKKQDNQLKLF